MNWTEHQTKALNAVEEWFKSKDRKQIFRVFGYAGTGKTSLARHFAEHVDGEVMFAAYTGKAALMLRKNGCVGASTIHSLIYKAEEDEDGVLRFKINHKSSLKNAKLLVVDECSMVDEKIGRHILSFGVPVLVLGDPAQLPPVGGAGFFTEAEPDVMLTEIHRQAKDNPIIYLATLVRHGKMPGVGQFGDSVVTDRLKTSALIEHDQVIVGRNKTRNSINKRMREMLGFEGDFPQVKDRLICLKNDSQLGIFNGGMFEVQAKYPNRRRQQFPLYKVKDMDDENSRSVLVNVHNSFFTGEQKPHWKFLKGSHEFDFGYGITTHKAQGSQWEKGLIFDESWCFQEHAQRWLYTSITRAQEKITLHV